LYTFARRIILTGIILLRCAEIHDRLMIVQAIKKPVRNESDGLNTVENIGVEPMTSCMPCKRSSQLS
jgi:hypothetical protein